MSGFMPSDLARWALGGGAGNNNADDDDNDDKKEKGEEQITKREQPLTDDEMRARRLARMNALMAGNSSSNEKDEEETKKVSTDDNIKDDAMDIDDNVNDRMDFDIDEQPKKKKAAAAAFTTVAASTNNAAAITTATNKSTPSQQQQQQSPEQQKRKRMAPTKTVQSSSLLVPADAAARKLQRKKELMLQKVLHLSLTPQKQQSSSTTSTIVEIDLGNNDPEITVQTIAEILAVRLAMSSDCTELRSLPMNVKALVPYLAQCYKRSCEEIRSLSQKQQSDANKDSSINDELLQILEEICKQVVSYAASSLMEPDLFELGDGGTVQLANALMNSGSVGDPTASITFGILKGGSSSSFYYMLCEELLSQDISVFESVITDVINYYIKILSRSDTILDGDNTVSAPPSTLSSSSTTSSSTTEIPNVGGYVIVNAITSLCIHKKAALCLIKNDKFLLPKADTIQAQERVTLPMPQLPPGATPRQQQLHRLMMAMSSRNNSRSYLKRSGPGLEKETILGLILRLGLPRDNPNVGQPFHNVTTRNAVDNITSGMRRQMKMYQDSCNALIKSLVTAGPDIRQAFMEWIADSLVLNVGADAMRPDATKVSNNQTLLNLLIILLKLCDPFVGNEKKFKLIDPGFVWSTKANGGVYTTNGDDVIPRLGGEDIIEEYKDKDVDYNPKNGFIPQLFFFTARVIHLSIVPMTAYHMNLMRQISHTHWQLRSRNADITTDPQFNHLLMIQHASEVTLLAPDMIQDVLRFLNLSAELLLKIDDELLPGMPEHYVEDICDVITFVTRMSPKSMERLDLANIFRVVVKLLSPKYAHTVRNYNLRAKLGDVLYDVYLPSSIVDDHRSSVPDSVTCDPLAGGQPFLLSDKSAQETLAPSLLLLYGEVEHTGYYEKMGHRANISSLLKYLWESKEHRPAFRHITQDKEKFIKFANGIMNETNSLIASVMEKLPQIRQVQVQMANAQEWGALSEEQRETITSRHEDNEQEVKRALPLCNKTLQMLGYLNTDPDIRNLFLLQEMCSRLVNMLLHVLTKLVGSRGLELKVDNPESYNFRPKEMLRDLCGIFATFSSAQEFQVDCAKSGYYNSGLVNKAVKTCKKLGLLTGKTMELFESFPELVEEASKAVASDDALLHDAPEEFLDPLVFTFMKDPVFLPTSETVIDRSTITQHLLNDPHDPFNRKDLTIDMVVPATELKEKMDKWLDKKRGAAANAE